MAPIELPFVQIVTAKGRRYAYYRRGTLRSRIPGEIGTPSWLAAYQELHQQAESQVRAAPGHPAAEPGSLRALWLAYMGSNAWKALKPGTQNGYTALIEPLLPKYGSGQVRDITPKWIQRRMDDMTPPRANHFLAVIRLLLNWSVPRGWIKASPATGIKRVKHRAESHRIWTDAEIKAMTGLDAGLMRMPVLIALYTGQRLGDVLRLPWSAYDGTAITVAAQAKTAARVVVPACPELRQALDAAKPEGAERKSLVICTRQDGFAWKERHFKAVFAATRKRLGLPDDLHFHGLRHSAAVRLAEAGCTPHEIAAVTGHKSLAMVSRYTQQVQQEQLAGTAIARLGNKPGTKV